MSQPERVTCAATAKAAADMSLEQVDAALAPLFAEVREHEARAEAAKRKIRALKDARAAKTLQARGVAALESAGFSRPAALHAVAGIVELSARANRAGG